jgi:hypothetical protein
MVAVARGQSERAIRLAGAAASQWAEVAAVQAPFWKELFGAALERAERSVDPAVRDNAWRDGALLPFEQAVAYARAGR